MKDTLYLSIRAGDGGNGIVHWRHLPTQPKAGPDGGDGGNGGDIYALAVRDVLALGTYRNRQTVSAEDGGDGMRQEKKGRNGNDAEVIVPVGSIITNFQTNERFYLTTEGQRELIAVGGRGGFGNAYFKSSHNTTPTHAIPGQVGQKYDIYINLKLIADVGLIGLPNAGKSTLLNILTRAHAKVGAYPFTTLTPNLGVFYGLLFADIPGVIAGSAHGKGLGHSFLKHIQSTRYLLHLVSLERDNPFGDYEIVRDELQHYAPTLCKKPEIIILTKSDTVSHAHIEQVKKKFPFESPVVSVYDTDALRALKKHLSRALRELKGMPVAFEKEDIVTNTPE